MIEPLIVLKSERRSQAADVVAVPTPEQLAAMRFRGLRVDTWRAVALRLGRVLQAIEGAPSLSEARRLAYTAMESPDGAALAVDATSGADLAALERQFDGDRLRDARDPQPARVGGAET